MITTAIILAAGCGSRLATVTGHVPKGLLRLGTRSLVERSCEQLVEAGVDRIVIGTGYAEADYRAFARRFPAASVECVRNRDYRHTGSMRTLAEAAAVVHEPCLVLESDLLYEPRALQAVLAAEEEDVVLGSGFTHSGDEVFIEVDADGLLCDMSKRPNELRSVDAELVGITKLGVGSLECAVQVEREKRRLDPAMDYEQCLVHVSRLRMISVLLVEDLVWCEIDDEHHLRRARDVVLPSIEAAAAESNHISRERLTHVT